MEDLTVDREFAAFWPELTEEAEAKLLANLQSDGCTDPIITWANHQGIILDGYHRYKLCRKNKIRFTTKAIALPTREAALQWIFDRQLGRRNITESQRSYCAALLVNSQSGRPKGATVAPFTTVADAAEKAGVSERLVQYAAKVQEDGSKQLQAAVRDGEIPVAQAAVIVELPKDQQAKLVAKGPEAVAAKVKKLKGADKPKQYKDSFDTGKLGKELKKEKKPGSVKKEWSDHAFIEATGQFGKEIDAAYAGFLKLIDECHANCGGRESDVARVKRAANYGKAESHKLLRGMIDGFRVWRPAK